MNNDFEKRLVPEIPLKDKVLRIIIDTDAANEIDDLYAIALAIKSPDRFNIEGFVVTHFAASGGPESTELSYNILLKLLIEAGMQNKYVVKKGGHPIRYSNTPSHSEGVDYIIERARAGSENDPLWVLGLGASTNLASAILLAPDIIPKVRYIFHARSENTWPERSVQYNVYGDIIAAKTLLESNVPLVWFDTGTHICADYLTTKKYLSTEGSLGTFLHSYRDTRVDFMSKEKGFFDLGDVAYLINPDICKTEILPTPSMTRWMYFDHNLTFGKMLRVSDIDVKEVWRIMFERIKRN